jgi:hypothetical protein
MAKYGKMLLSAYTMKKIISCKSKKGRGMRSKYVKLFLLGYILKKLSFKTSKSTEYYNKIETEERKLNKPMTKFGTNKFTKIILELLIGAIAIHIFKKHFTRQAGNKIEVNEAKGV